MERSERSAVGRSALFIVPTLISRYGGNKKLYARYQPRPCNVNYPVLHLELKCVRHLQLDDTCTAQQFGSGILGMWAQSDQAF